VAAFGRARIVAHRGDHRRHVENTLPALLAALDHPSCDGLEFDVRLSRDGVPVLCHDPTPLRVHGRPEAVDGLSVEELRAIGVSRLDDVLAAVPRRAFLDVEVKVEIGRPLVETLAAGRGPNLSNAVISSFDAGALRRVRGLAPDWPTWLIARDLSPATLDRAVDIGCRGVSIEWHALDRRGLAATSAAGLDVAAWTVTRRPTRDRLARLGVGTICVEGRALDP